MNINWLVQPLAAAYNPVVFQVGVALAVLVALVIIAIVLLFKGDPKGQPAN